MKTTYERIVAAIALGCIIFALALNAYVRSSQTQLEQLRSIDSTIQVKEIDLR